MNYRHDSRTCKMKTKERRCVRRQRDKDITNTYYRHVDNDHSLIITTDKTDNTI